MPALSILIWLPLACGLVGALVSAVAESEPAVDGGSDGTERDGPARAGWSAPGMMALIGSLAALALAIGYIADYKAGGGLQHVTDVVWIATLGIHYKLAVTRPERVPARPDDAAVRGGDARGEPAQRRRAIERPRLFYFNFMLAESAVLGAFLAQDLALFVAFFDLMLIPFYFLIGGWGQGPDRVKATIKLVIYTLVGSLLMLAGGGRARACSPRRTAAGTSRSCSPHCRRCRWARARRSGSSCCSPRRSS